MTSTYFAPRTCGRCGAHFTIMTSWNCREHKVTICGTCRTARAHDAASSARSDPGIPMPRLDGGLCAGQDPEIWQADDAETIAYAVDECLHCPIRAACLAWAMDSGERFGIWGGLTPRERERLRRRTRSAAV